MSGIFRGRLWVTGVGIALLALAVLTAISYWPNAQPPQAKDPSAQSVQNGAGSDGAKSADASLQELVERLLSGPMGSTGRANLLPGKLPDDLPVSLSALEGWRIVGSVTYSQTGSDASNGAGGMIFMSGNMGHWTVVLDAPGSPGTASDAVQNSLKNQGWTVQDQNMLTRNDSGGFQSSGDVSNQMSGDLQLPGGQIYHMLQLCSGSKSLFLTLGAYPLDSSKAGVNLSIGNFGPIGCSTPGMVMPNKGAEMPSLTPPDGVSVMPAGGSYGGATSLSEASAITDKSAGWLEDFYAKQLEKAGWTRQDGKDEGAFAWSIWHVSSTEGEQGFLYVLATPAGKTSMRALQLRIDSDPGSSAISLFGSFHSTQTTTDQQKKGTK